LVVDDAVAAGIVDFGDDQRGQGPAPAVGLDRGGERKVRQRVAAQDEEGLFQLALELLDASRRP